MDLQHYEGRLETILGKTGYQIALELLTYTATHGCLDGETVRRYESISRHRTRRVSLRSNMCCMYCIMMATSNRSRTERVGSFQAFLKTGGVAAMAETSFQSLEHSRRVMTLNDDGNREKV